MINFLKNLFSSKKDQTQNHISSFNGTITFHSRKRHIEFNIPDVIYKRATGCMITENPNDVLDNLHPWKFKMEQK